MKKIKWKSVLALILVLTMALPLAGCGKNTEGEQTQEEADTGFTYVSEFVDVSDGDQSFWTNTYTESGIYSVLSEVIGEQEHEEPAEYEGQYDIYGSRLYLIDYDGGLTKLNYAPEVPVMEEGHNVNTSVSSVAVLDDGRIAVLECIYDSWSTNTDAEVYSDDWYNGYQENNTYDVAILDDQGNLLQQIPVEAPEGAEWFSPYNMTASGDNLVCTWDQGLFLINVAEGTSACVATEDYIDSLFTLQDGTLYAARYGDNGYEILPLDAEKGTFGKAISMPYNCYSVLPGGGDYDLYFTSGSSFYGFSFETGESQKLFGWLDVDVNSNDLDGATVLEDGTVVVLVNEWNSDYSQCLTQLAKITRKPSDQVAARQELTLACQYLEYDLQDLVLKFNRSHDDVRIRVKDYSEYNTEDDYSAGLTKLQTELVSGNVPDILYLDGISARQYAAKGMFEDLYTYIDADPDMERGDFFPSVLAAFENNGQLYSTVSSFSVMTVCGAASVVGTEQGWTYEAFLQAWEEMKSVNPDCEPFDQYTTRSGILQTILSLEEDNLVDWNTGKCSFDTPEFASLLEFTSLFPEEFDWENYDYTAEESTIARISSGKQMLLAAYVYDFTSIQEYRGYFGGQCTFVGYPTSQGSGSMITANAGYAICSGCSNKEAAWEFLRTFFTEDYQNDSYQFPSIIQCYNKKLEQAMTPTYEQDEDGNYILDENGEKIEMPAGGMTFEDGTEFSYYAMTQEEAQQVYDLILSADSVYSYDTTIYNAVVEQAEAYWSGQKSAEETAKLIQSKMNLYVNEQR